MWKCSTIGICVLEARSKEGSKMTLELESFFFFFKAN